MVSVLILVSRKYGHHQIYLYSSKNKMISSIFDQDDDFENLTEKFIKKLKGCIAQNFQKIRINGTRKTKSDILYKKLRDIKDKDDEASMSDRKQIEDEIADITEEN